MFVGWCWDLRAQELISKGLLFQSTQLQPPIFIPYSFHGMFTMETGNSCKRDRGGEEEKGRERGGRGEEWGQEGRGDGLEGREEGWEGGVGRGGERGGDGEGSSCRREGERREVGGV